MKRALRRHRLRVKKARRIRILKIHGAWTTVWEGEWLWAPDPWREVGRQCMVDPGWWVHENIIQPARIRSNQLLQKVFLGKDTEDILWPDYRKPYLYYW
jgi:hypothetical protein